MKFMEKVWGSIGLFETHAEDEKVRSDELEPKPRKAANNIVNLPTTQQKSQTQIKVMVVEPFSFDDAQHIADHLKNRKPVVVNFENTDKEVAKRLVDFISGTTYALGGNIQKVGHDIFLCAPSNVDVSYSSLEEGADKAFFPWTSKS